MLRKRSPRFQLLVINPRNVNSVETYNHIRNHSASRIMSKYKLRCLHTDEVIEDEYTLHHSDGALLVTEYSSQLNVDNSQKVLAESTGAGSSKA